ncbi:P-type conjugative transfer protein TrbG [Porphyrobacter sp. YT40]|uniref:P-type conjugative transfer protein TrbG n=1 Tax=Porphyrobacter sp. YT40 TaxID=2547601 RepID=UPI001141B4E1|nr:P-type conjugative transfer protein TrbG [Porphyrobacter sp. YT40]QDH33835.1 P-type conjugative transfer protein TrbG [Porphyrobacter sp. YT40]
MTRLNLPSRCMALALATSCALVAASPVFATPVPQARAACAALVALTTDLPVIPLQASLPPAPPSRQASPPAARRSPAPGPEAHVGAANAAARVEPEDAGFENAIQRYAYSEGALYQVYTAPGQVTDIALQVGEQLVGPGPVASGDTVRWMIGDTLSGAGTTRRVHILVKPTRPGIATNLVINTDRRTYHLELRATAHTWMASVSWTYPDDELIALRRAEADAVRAAPIAAGLVPEQFNFDYRLSGDRPRWRPVRVFDDGQRTLIEFAPDIAQGELPPFFVLGEDDTAELANYRVSGRYLIVDRLFERGELRLGAGRRQQRVTITNRARGAS